MDFPDPAGWWYALGNRAGNAALPAPRTDSRYKTQRSTAWQRRAVRPDAITDRMT